VTGKNQLGSQNTKIQKIKMKNEKYTYAILSKNKKN